MKVIHGYHSKTEYELLGTLINKFVGVRIVHGFSVVVVKKNILIRLKRRLKIIFNVIFRAKLNIEGRYI